jgi:hypothetical protein
VFFHQGSRATYKYGASDSDHQDSRANHLIMWRAVQWYSSNGYSTLNFGRTSLGNEGLRRFKSSWGAVERGLSYFRYDYAKRTFSSPEDRATGWHTPLFRNLPLFLSRWVGSCLYKHIA